MSQQQMLTAIIVAIVLAISAVVAINTIGRTAETVNTDAIRDDLAKIKVAAQNYYKKSKALGGGGQSFAGITWYAMDHVPVEDSTDMIAKNENGQYMLKPGKTSLTILAVAINDSIKTIPARVCSDGMAIGSIGDTTAPAESECQ